MGDGAKQDLNMVSHGVTIKSPYIRADTYISVEAGGGESTPDLLNAT